LKAKRYPKQLETFGRKDQIGFPEVVGLIRIGSHFLG